MQHHSAAGLLVRLHMQGGKSQGLGAGNTTEGPDQTRAKGAALPYKALMYTPLPQGLQRVPTAQPRTHSSNPCARASP